MMAPPAKKTKALSKKTVAKKAVAKKASAKKNTTVKKASGSKAATKARATPKKAASKKATVKTVSSSSSSSGAKSRNLLENGPQRGFTPYKEKRGEDYMNEPMAAHFHDILVHWKKDLMEEVDRTVHHMQDDAANFPDPNDRASQESDFTMELRTRDRERKLIKKIDEALTSLNIGEYGYCESCGIEIGVRRLEARPTATLCIDCKMIDELREKKIS